MLVSGLPIEPTYQVQRVEYGSEGFREHLDLVVPVYHRSGFIKSPSPDLLQDAFDSSEAAYFLLKKIKNPSDQGTFRIVQDTGLGLPLFKVFKELKISGSFSQLCEVTRVAARRSALSGRTSQSVLFETVIQSVRFAKKNNMEAVISLGSPKIFERINYDFSNCQRKMGEPIFYEGGIVVPSIVWVEEFENIQRTHAPEIYDYYCS